MADITKMRVDAIVNSANRSLLGGGGVDRTIHRAAGVDLVMACADLGGCEVGHAKATDAFALPAKRVIHAVGPAWLGGDEDVEKLASCYRESLDIAVNFQRFSTPYPEAA